MVMAPFNIIYAVGVKSKVLGFCSEWSLNVGKYKTFYLIDPKSYKTNKTRPKHHFPHNQF